MANYEVVGACVTDIPVSTQQGPMRTTVYKGAVLTDDVVPAERIRHLLDVKLIKKIGGDEPKAKAPVPAKQPETSEGGAPKFNARTPKGDLVEHAVAKGDMTREDAEKLTLKDLQDLYVRKTEPAE